MLRPRVEIRCRHVYANLFWFAAGLHPAERVWVLAFGEFESRSVSP